MSQNVCEPQEVGGAFSAPGTHFPQQKGWPRVPTQLSAAGPLREDSRPPLKDLRGLLLTH